MKKVCSFCGRGENDVRLLITGISGFICEDCAMQAHDIVLSSGVLGAQHQKKGGKKSPGYSLC